MPPPSFSAWPVLARYAGEHLRRVAMPLGGIGTGSITLGGRGDLRDWEIINRPARAFAPSQAFFALRTQSADGTVFCRALEGPISPHDYEGSSGCRVPHHGLPRFGSASFEAAFPLGQVVLSDESCPLEVRLQAFSPLVPGDSSASGFPIAQLRFVLHNPTSRSVSASVAGCMENFIGRDATSGASQGNVNQWREGGGLRGLFCSSETLPTDAPQWGTLALAVVEQEGQSVSGRTRWGPLVWGNALLDYWEDFAGDGALEEVAEPHGQSIASLGASVEIGAGQTQALTFLVGWHFPNRLTWTPDEPAQGMDSEGGTCGVGAPIIGNFYTTQFSDAWDALEQFAPRRVELEDKTVAWVCAFCASDWPAAVKEAALFNLSTLVSQTVFRTPDGLMFGWEGSMDRDGSCPGSCTHVWNYEQATAFLWGDLARSMRDVEFLHATDDNGKMSYRVGLPLERATVMSLAAADGQMGCLLKLYRDWQLSGDDAWLRKLWPHAKRTLEFCWIKGGWDADGDGVMEGCQHNTMDVEYFGPNPQMQGWYLGALRASEEMARYLGEEDFAAKCHELFENGSRWMDENLWNGEYYEHQIWPPSSDDAIAAGLCYSPRSASELQDPDLQLGAGCLVDQMVGQYFAHLCGLGDLHDPAHVRGALQSVVRHNQQDFRAHFNSLRSYVLNDERGVLMGSYPLGRRPAKPFPYATEVMTGFEYTAAVGLLQVGEIEAGVGIIADIRARYDGLKRNPFDEAECGRHYARAMTSWAATLALSGFEFSAVSRTMRFAAAPERANWFWSNGAAWGTFEQMRQGDKIRVNLKVGGGELKLRKLELRDFGAQLWPAEFQLEAGQNWQGEIGPGVPNQE